MSFSFSLLTHFFLVVILVLDAVIHGRHMKRDAIDVAATVIPTVMAFLLGIWLLARLPF